MVFIYLAILPLFVVYCDVFILLIEQSKSVCVKKSIADKNNWAMTGIYLTDLRYYSSTENICVEIVLPFNIRLMTKKPWVIPNTHLVL